MRTTRAPFAFALICPCPSAFAFIVAVAEAGVAQARADRQHAPAFNILHEGNLGQPLHHAVVVHYDGRIVLPDLRDGLDHTCRQMREP